MRPGSCNNILLQTDWGKQTSGLTRRSLDETIAAIDRCLKMTGCRIVECKQAHTNNMKSNNPLPHSTEKSVVLYEIYVTELDLTMVNKII